MQYKKSILFGVVFSLVFFSVMPSSSAQGLEIVDVNEVPPREEKFNIDKFEATYLSNKNTLETKMTIANNEDFFISGLGLKFEMCWLMDPDKGLDHVSEGVDNLECIHRHISDQKISLASKQVIDISEGITLPTTLFNKEYYLLAEIGDRDGSTYSKASFKLVDFEVETVEQPITITKESILNEAKYDDFEFRPLVGLTFDKEEKPLVKLEVKNGTDEQKDVIPKYKIYRRTFFGDLKQEGEGDPTAISAGEDSVLYVNLPVMKEPQSYIVDLQLFDQVGNALSDSREIRYVFHGLSASFTDIQVTPDKMQNGTPATVRFIVYGSADTLAPGAEDTSTPVKESQVQIEIIDSSSQRVLGERTVDLVLDQLGKIVSAEVEIDQSSESFDVKISLVKDGQVLAESQVENVIVEKDADQKVRAYFSDNWPVILGIIGGVMFLLLLTLLIVRMQRNRSRGGNTNNTQI